MLEVLPQARLDAWAGGAPLILTESRSLAGVLRALVSAASLSLRRLNMIKPCVPTVTLSNRNVTECYRNNPHVCDYSVRGGDALDVVACRVVWVAWCPHEVNRGSITLFYARWNDGLLVL